MLLKRTIAALSSNHEKRYLLETKKSSLIVFLQPTILYTWDQDHPQEKETQKAKWVSEEALQTAVKRRNQREGKGEKERYAHLIAEFQRRARRDKKAFLSD